MTKGDRSCPIVLLIHYEQFGTGVIDLSILPVTTLEVARSGLHTVPSTDPTSKFLDR